MISAMIGRQLGNRYEIIEQLGGGGMAIVYKGRDNFLGRLVTIKVLRPEYSCDANFTFRFRREARAVASLSHPNIVSIYDVGQEDGIHYLVMEYVDGEDLKSIIRREGSLSPERAVAIAYQVLEALEHAHENGIVHRDIKPHNILITRSGRAKLTDFGIAREATAATVTQADTILGSVHYLSPEQARGEPAEPRSDLYSLGVVLYEMLTGTVPFTGESPIAVALRHVQEDPEPPSRRNPAVLPALEEVVLRALQKKPSRRFSSAREMAESLKQAIGEEEEEATRVIPQLSKPRVRRRLRPAGWAVLFLLLGAILAGGFWAWERYYFGTPEVQVPNVVGLPLEEAQAVLAQLGLKTAVKRAPSEAKERIVIAQDIGPEGPRVKPPRTITLTVSSGPEMRVVPNLYRLSLEDARMRLAESGFTLAEPVQKGYSEEVPAGYIFGQMPGPGEKRPRDTPVTVYLSEGPPPRQVEVPGVVGLTLEQARAKLAESQLDLDENLQWAESTAYLQGQVVAQNPPQGARVNQGTKVRLTLSRGPGPLPREARIKVPVPNDGREHQVKINISDVRGSNTVYLNTHRPGEQVEVVSRYFGQATVEVYIDERLVKKETLKP